MKNNMDHIILKASRNLLEIQRAQEGEGVVTALGDKTYLNVFNSNLLSAEEVVFLKI